jgi:pilus assembly protein Flp/PilA
MSLISKFIRDEDGVTAIEYALVASLIAVAIISAASTLGTKIAKTFGNITNNLS